MANLTKTGSSLHGSQVLELDTSGCLSQPQQFEYCVVVNGKVQKLMLATREVPGDHDCAICCQSLRSAAVTLPCSEHGCRSFFHSVCICPWLERKQSCPL